MKIVKAHNLGSVEAKKRVENLGEFLIKNGLNVVWETENVAKVTGKYIVIQIEATVSVSDSQVVIDGKDPGFLWRKKATEFLQQKLNEVLS